MGFVILSGIYFLGLIICLGFLLFPFFSFCSNILISLNMSLHLYYQIMNEITS
jgi:hypothetical protein